MKCSVAICGALGMVSLFGVGCTSSATGEGDGTKSSSQALTFHAEAPALPDLSFDTGPLPASGPAQVSFKMSAQGSISVDTAGSIADGKLEGSAGAGKLHLDMHVKSAGHLTVDTHGVTYDGPLPGLSTLDIPILGDATFDGFALDGSAPKVDVKLAETKLPDIPLGTVPGHLEVTVATGSELTLTFKPQCLAVSDGKATFGGVTEASGSLVLKASIVLDVPLVDPIALPPIKVPLPKADHALASAAIDAPGAADGTTGTCAAAGGGKGSGSGSGSGGGGSSPNGGGGADGGTGTGGGNDGGTTGSGAGSTQVAIDGQSVRVFGVYTALDATGVNGQLTITTDDTGPVPLNMVFVGVDPGQGCTEGSVLALVGAGVDPSGSKVSVAFGTHAGDPSCGLAVTHLIGGAQPTTGSFHGYVYLTTDDTKKHWLDVVWSAPP